MSDVLVGAQDPPTLLIIDPSREPDAMGRPRPLLHVWAAWRVGSYTDTKLGLTNRWVMGALSNGASLCGSYATYAEAVRVGGQWLLEHGEFDALLDALFGWIGEA